MWRFARTYYNNVEKGRVVRDKRVKLSAFSWEGWLFALLVRVLLCGGGRCTPVEGRDMNLYSLVKRPICRLLLRVGIKVVDAW